MYVYTDEYLEVYDVVEVEDCSFSHYLHHFEEFCDGLVFDLPSDEEHYFMSEESAA